MISAYNRRMRESSGPSGFILFILLVFLFLSAISAGQAAKKTPTSAAGDAERATTLAESGHCPEALPLLKRAIRQTTDRDLKRRIGLDGLHCAMNRDTPYDS